MFVKECENKEVKNSNMQGSHKYMNATSLAPCKCDTVAKPLSMVTVYFRPVVTQMPCHNQKVLGLNPLEVRGFFFVEPVRCPLGSSPATEPWQPC